MRMRGAASRVDQNHKRIVADLRKAGILVLDLSTLGKGAPDIACAHAGLIYFMEIKNPKRKYSLTNEQLYFHLTWKGYIHVIESVDDALRAMGLK